MHSGHDWTVSVFERIIQDAFNINVSYTYFASNAFLELKLKQVHIMLNIYIIM